MKLKLIQVGLGAHGRGVCENIVLKSPDFELVGLVDIDFEQLKEFSHDHGLSENILYTDYRQAFREAEADTVMVEAASPVHYDICKLALENGLHVLVEKPFVLKMADAEELVDLAQSKNRIIMVNQNYRYFSSVLTLKHAIKESSLGKLLFINGQFYCDHSGKPYQREMKDYILMEMSIHHIDMIRFLLDTDIRSVTGTCWNWEGSGYKGEPNVNAVFETELGIPVVYTSSLLAKGISMPWEGTWRIQYEEGAIYMDDLGDGYGVYIVNAEGLKNKLPFIVPELESMHGVLDEFARSIFENREPAISGRHNLNTLSALFATSQSSKLGTRVQISSIAMK